MIKKYVTFRGRKYKFKVRFPDTAKGKEDAKDYAKRRSVDWKTYTVVKRFPDEGYCVYTTE